MGTGAVIYIAYIDISCVIWPTLYGRRFTYTVSTETVWKTSICTNALKAEVAKHKWSDSARFALHLSIHYQSHHKTRQQYQQPIKKLLLDISALQQSFTNLLSYIKHRGECDYVTIKQHNKDTLFISGSRDSRRAKSHNHRFNNECGR